MAINANALRRPSDRPLFVAAAILFPLVVLAGYFKSYYFSAFFDVPSVANMLVHAHALVMTLWVAYFSAQIALIRTKNVRAHMTMGLVGIVLAALVVVVGTATAYDAQLVRGSAPPGVNPRSFFVLPMLDMALFVVFFAGAIYYRKRPTEHKALMLMTAIAFMPAALFRLPVVPPQHMLHWAFGVPMLVALACFGWHRAKHRKLNKVFAASVLLIIAAHPLRIALLSSDAWLRFTAWLAP
ncbi:MAG TPA: hypothetical protein VK388_09020 [Pyrinomonadaceae bacterium]|nr:hypothetical protein [Pyrinomonadaceae bacterium]